MDAWIGFGIAATNHLTAVLMFHLLLAWPCICLYPFAPILTHPLIGEMRQRWMAHGLQGALEWIHESPKIEEAILCILFIALWIRIPYLFTAADASRDIRAQNYQQCHSDHTARLSRICA